MREMRKREHKRLTPAMCSPFNQRILQVGPKLTSDEKDMYYYILGTRENEK